MLTMARYLSRLISNIRQRGWRTTLSLGAIKVRTILELFIPQTIWGGRIGLRPVKSSLSKVEAEQVYGWSHDTEVLRWSGGTPTNLTLDEFYNQLRHERWRPSWNERVFYIVTRAGDLIGRVGLFAIDWDKGEGELGILIDKKYWSRQYGRDAVKLLLQYVWAATPLQRVYLNTATDNVRAQRSFSACGFRTVGVGRRYIAVTGDYVAEGIQMEILRKGLPTKPMEEGL